MLRSRLHRPGRALHLRLPDPDGVVFYLHGNAGNISHRIDYLQMFHRLGYATLIVDYRGYGESTGSPTEAGTYLDALASWRWLSARATEALFPAARARWKGN